MPEKFIWSEPSVAAEGSSSSGTASGISAVQTGAQDVLADALFRPYFTEGLHMGKNEVLAVA